MSFSFHNKEFYNFRERFSRGIKAILTYLKTLWRHLIPFFLSRSRKNEIRCLWICLLINYSCVTRIFLVKIFFGERKKPPPTVCKIVAREKKGREDKNWENWNIIGQFIFGARSLATHKINLEIIFFFPRNNFTYCIILVFSVLTGTIMYVKRNYFFFNSLVIRLSAMDSLHSVLKMSGSRTSVSVKKSSFWRFPRKSIKAVADMRPVFSFVLFPVIWRLVGIIGAPSSKTR